MPVTNATYIPLALISGIFFPGQGGPAWLATLTRAMPMRALSESFQACFLSRPGAGFEPERLAVVLAWTLAGAVVSARFFRWSPTRTLG